jgi:hypothetical protein
MKQLVYALIVACTIMSCSGKGELDFFKGPLQSVAKARYNGLLEVQFNPVYCTGPIVKCQWAIDPTSPTQDNLFAASVVGHTGLVPFVEQVHRPGVYTFSLTVYDRAGNVNSDTVNLNITGSLYP